MPSSAASKACSERTILLMAVCSVTTFLEVNMETFYEIANKLDKSK